MRPTEEVLRAIGRRVNDAVYRERDQYPDGASPSGDVIDEVAGRVAWEACTNLGTLHVYRVVHVYVVAENYADAWAVWEDATGRARCYYDEDDCEQLRDDEVPVSPMLSVEQTASSWVAQRGRGFLG